MCLRQDYLCKQNAVLGVHAEGNRVTSALSGRRRPGEHVGVPLLNEITDALKTQEEIVLTDEQKLRLEALLQTGQIVDSISGHTMTSAHEIVSSKRVVVRNGKAGAGIEWRFEEL